LAARYDLNPKTVAKWRKRNVVEDARMGPASRSTVLTAEQEAVVVTFRQHTLLPLDDCLYALQATIPKLSRSVLQRCFQRHGISRLPQLTAHTAQVKKRKFKAYPIGCVHIDITEVTTAEGKLHLFVAIDRTAKFAVAQLQERATMRTVADCLHTLVQALPYRIHTVLTDNGIQFADLPKNRPGATALWRGHPFARADRLHRIEHRLTKPNHPWTNGQVERMNRTIKAATVRTYHDDHQAQLQSHLNTFLNAYNFAKRLKTLHGLTPYQFICSCCQKEP
jgi:transposase InsO family protein